MVNLTSCKMYIKQVSGQLDPTIMYQKLNALKQQHRIIQDIEVYKCDAESSVEVRFGARWFPDTDMLEEIFPPSHYEIWIIGSDEGGLSDSVDYYPSEKSPIEEVNEAALYKFDEIELHGDIDAIKKHLEQQYNILSWYTQAYSVEHSHIKLYESGVYKANNYFMNDENNQINVTSIESIPVLDNLNKSRFRDMIWDSDSIDFINRFYDNNLERYSKGSKYHFLNKIVFKYKGRVTNSIEQTEKGEQNNWIHHGANNFFNLVNPSFVLFKHLNKQG